MTVSLRDQIIDIVLNVNEAVVPVRARKVADAIMPLIDAQARADAAAIERVRALCVDTDGNVLNPEAELPVGEFQNAIRALDGDPT